MLQNISKSQRIISSKILQFLNFHQRNQLSTKVKTLDLSGIFPPIVTPFLDNSNPGEKPQICYESLEKNFKIWNKIPFRGYVVMGSNGEAVSLSSQEKIKLTKEVKRLAPKSSLIIAGTGGPGTDETIELTNAVADVADAALIITPFFYKNLMTDKTLRQHFEAVADNSKIPIILYNVPANTSIDMTDQLTIDLAQHPNIIGVKFSDGNIGKITRVIYETRDLDFQVLAGSAGFLLPGLFMGCVGGITAVANVLGQELCDLHTSYLKGDLSKAVDLQKRLLMPNDLVTRKFGVSGLKSSMELIGLYPGQCRRPLSRLDEPQLTELKLTFEKFGFPLDKKY